VVECCAIRGVTTQFEYTAIIRKHPQFGGDPARDVEFRGQACGENGFESDAAREGW